MHHMHGRGVCMGLACVHGASMRAPTRHVPSSPPHTEQHRCLTRMQHTQLGAKLYWQYLCTAHKPVDKAQLHKARLQGHCWLG